MEPPDFEKMAMELLPRLITTARNRTAQHAFDEFTAALRQVHADAIESAARVAEQRKPTNPRDDWTEYAMIVNAEAEKTADAIRALAKEDGNAR